MNREATEREVLRVLREDVLMGSDRPIDADAPLGTSAGLDSLALVEFIGALEGAFDIDLPDTLWSDRRAFTLGHLIDHLADADPEDGD